MGGVLSLFMTLGAENMKSRGIGRVVSELLYPDLLSEPVALTVLKISLKGLLHTAF